MMGWRDFGPLVLAMWCLGGCAGMELGGREPGPGPGHSVEELVAQNGQPQEILSGPQGGQIYVYKRTQMAHPAIMGGGAWGKPEDTLFWLDAQGKIYKVTYYPYGKRRFIFPTEEEPGVAARPTPQAAPEEVAPAVPSPPGPSPTVTLAPTPPAAPALKPTPAPTPTPAPAPTRISPQEGMAASTRLELRMSKGEVEHLLGVPDHTEGFLVGNTPVVIWFYVLEDRHGRRVVTPLVFREGRLTGWGEAYYQRVLGEVRGQRP